MQDIPSERSAIIRKIRRSFFAHRRDYPDQLHVKSDKLRELVREALSQGHKPGVVAQAASLNRGTIVSWARQAIESTSRKPQYSAGARLRASSPVELKIVKSRSAQSPQMQMSQPTVRIYFRSGAFMDCPVSELSVELLSALNGGAA